MRFIRTLSQQCWLLSFLWALSVGITVPVLLTCLCNGWRWEANLRKGMDETPVVPPDVTTAFVQFIQLEGLALLFCGPGAFVLALIVYAIMLNTAKKGQLPPHKLIELGAIWGIGMAFANLPGYLSGALLSWDDSLTELRVAGLFIIAGIISGSWIGWQAYRATHPEAPFFPQYSLKTLLLLVIITGCVMMLYAPQPA